jgi:3-hydroxypropanoate dehydrogenase
MTSPHNKDGKRISDESLDRLFRKARTHRAWLTNGVSPSLLREAYELARMGPTSANCSPARFVFLATDEAKQRLLPCLAPGNVEKTRTAPVVVVTAWDTEFYEKMPELMPQMDARSLFSKIPSLAQETVFRNSTLQGAYFILAARALGLDVGPMSGFDADKVNTEFFSDGKWKVNFLCNLGRGDDAKLAPRNPRLEFEGACLLL